MLSDDIAGIVLDHDGSPVVIPAFPRTKLWADSAQRLGRDITTLPRVRPRQEKYEIATHDQFAREPTNPHQIYLLTTSNTDELRLEAVDRIRRFGVVLHNTYRVSFLDGLSLRAPHFRLASAVAKAVPVTRVIRPHDPNRLNELVDMIEQDYRQTAERARIIPFSHEPVINPFRSAPLASDRRAA